MKKFYHNDQGAATPVNGAPSGAKKNAQPTAFFQPKPVPAIQQSAPGVSIQRKVWIGSQALTVDEAYKKIVKDTWGERAVKRLVELHTDGVDHRFSNWGALVSEYVRARDTPDAEQPAEEQNVCGNLPGYGQRGGTCAAASLITPALIWDREHYNPGDPNPRLRNLVIKMKAYIEANKAILEPRFDTLGKGRYRFYIETLDLIIKESASDSFVVTASHYEALSFMVMFMSQEKVSSGLLDSEMQTARNALGYPEKTTHVRFFDGLFTADGDLAKMQPGQMAQVTWFVKADQPADPLAPPPELPTHAFTIGRMADGTWVLNDQGYKTPLCLSGPDLASLKDAMMDASDDGRWAGVTDGNYHEPAEGVETGYAILGDEETLTP